MFFFCDSIFWSCAHFHILLRQTSMAKFLVQCGVDIGKVTHRGCTAYDFASEMLDTEMMRIFVEVQVGVLNLSHFFHTCVQIFHDSHWKIIYKS